MERTKENEHALNPDLAPPGYVAVKNHGCRGCDLATNPETGTGCEMAQFRATPGWNPASGICSEKLRPDGCSVIFKKLKKLEKPRKTMKRPKTYLILARNVAAAEDAEKQLVARGLLPPDPARIHMIRTNCTHDGGTCFPVPEIPGFSSPIGLFGPDQSQFPGDVLIVDAEHVDDEFYDALPGAKPKVEERNVTLGKLVELRACSSGIIRFLSEFPCRIAPFSQVREKADGAEKNWLDAHEDRFPRA